MMDLGARPGEHLTWNCKRKTWEWIKWLALVTLFLVVLVCIIYPLLVLFTVPVISAFFGYKRGAEEHWVTRRERYYPLTYFLFGLLLDCIVVPIALLVTALGLIVLLYYILKWTYGYVKDTIHYCLNK